MTQLESFRATLAHEPHDGVLFYSNFTPDLERRIREQCSVPEERTLRTHFGMYEPVRVQLRAPASYATPDFSAYYADVEQPSGSSINELGVLRTPGSLHHFTHIVSPLRNAAILGDIESFPYPEYETWTDAHMESIVEEAHARGRVVVCVVGHMFEDAWQIRGMEQFLMDTLIQPEWCEFILDRIAARNLVTARAAARAGVDVIITGDDVATQRGMMFAEDQWRRFLKCRWAEIYAAARRIKPDLAIWYHSDGVIETVIPELIDIGVTILNPVQPECIDPVEVKKKYGDKLVLDGTIGTQTIMPFGTLAEVRALVKDRIATLGKDSGLILSPTHTLEPDVPIDNVLAFVETEGLLRFS